jgi:acetyl esterase/lipase
MGQRFSLIGRHNRARQFRTLLELSFIVFLLRYFHINSPRFLLLRRLNDFFTRFAPWQICLSSIAACHIYDNLSVLLGLNAPHSSLSTEPDMHYTRNFSRCRVFLTALDAAVLSALRVRWAPLRHAISTWLMIYYLTHPQDADNKVNQFRNSLSVEHVRACWQKGFDHPILRLIDMFGRPHCKIDAEIVTIPRIIPPPSSDFIHSPTPVPLVFSAPITDDAIECRLFYYQDKAFLAAERRVILDFPGGGFIAMSPLHHADYLSAWALRLRVPLISVNYRKAPEYPYPNGLNDCYQVYKQIIQSNGKCIGINCSPQLSETLRAQPIDIAICGDSAGGNFALGVTLKAIMEKIRLPNGVHAIYPSLDMDSEVWRSDPVQELTLNPDNLSVERSSSSSSHSVTLRFSDQKSAITMKRQPSLSSRAIYAFDGVLPLKYQILLASLLFRDGNCDPKNDILCSPVRAPLSLLKQFPPLFIHVGGVDPLCDDSIRFVEKLRIANPDQRVQLHIIPGLSHAYMQISKLLPEGQQALRLSTVWLAEILRLPSPLTRDEHEQLLNFTDNSRALQSLRRRSTGTDRGYGEAARHRLSFAEPGRPLDSRQIGESLLHQTVTDIASPYNPVTNSTVNDSDQLPMNSVTVSTVDKDGIKQVSTVSIYSTEAAQLISAALSSPSDASNHIRVELENDSNKEISSKL